MAMFRAGLKRSRDDAPDQLSNDFFSVRAPSSDESVLVFRGKAGKERLWNSFDTQGGVVDYNPDQSKCTYSRPDGRVQHFKGGKGVEYKTKTVHPDGTEVVFAGYKRTEEKKRLVIKPDTGQQIYFNGLKGDEAKRIVYHQPGPMLPEQIVSVFRGTQNEEKRAFAVSVSGNLLHYKQLADGHEWVSAITFPADGSTHYFVRPDLTTDGTTRQVARKVAHDGTNMSANGSKQAFEKLDGAFKDLMEKMLELKEQGHCKEMAVVEMGKQFKEAHEWLLAYRQLAGGGSAEAM